LSARIGRLRKHPDHAIFRKRACCPTLMDVSREPAVNRIVADMVAINQCDQRIHIE